MRYQIHITGKTFVYIFLFYTLWTASFAQNTPDSLEKAIQSATDLSQKQKLIHKLGLHYKNTGKINKAVSVFRREVNLLKQTNKKKELATAYIQLSDCYLISRKLDSAEYYATKSLHVSESIPDIPGTLIAVNQLSRIYHTQLKDTTAISILLRYIQKYKDKFKALKGKKDTLAKEKLAVIYGNLGVYYSDLKMQDSAIHYFLLQKKTAQKVNFIQEIFKANSNIAYDYMDLKNYATAEKYFLRNVALYKQHPKEVPEAYLNSVYRSLGILYSRWGKYDQAFRYDTLAFRKLMENGKKLYAWDVLDNTAVLFIRKKEPARALPYARKALELSKEVQFPVAELASKLTLVDVLTGMKKYREAMRLNAAMMKDTASPYLKSRPVLKMDIINNAYILAKHLGRPREALDYFERYVYMKDSLDALTKEKEYAEIEKKYNVAERDRKIEKLKARTLEKELQLQKSYRQNILLGGGLGISIVMAGIFAFFYRRNRRQRMMIESLQRELHHRIKNNLALLNVLTDQIAREFDDARLRERLSDLKSRINSIHEIHSQLYRKQDVNKVNMKQYLEKLVNNVKETFKKENISVEIQVAENMDWSPGKTFPLGLFVVEFLINSFKYAFPDNKGGKIQIRLIKEGGRQVVLLKDDGVGIENEDLLKDKKTFGLNLLRALAKQMGGRMEIIQEKGFGLKLVF